MNETSFATTQFQGEFLTALTQHHARFGDRNGVEFLIPGTNIIVGRIIHPNESYDFSTESQSADKTPALWRDIFNARKTEILATIRQTYPNHQFIPIEFGKIAIQDENGKHVIIYQVSYGEWLYDFKPCGHSIN